MGKLKASEYVSLGHPDKMADYISSYILDMIICQDPNVRYALEVQVKDNNVFLAGEITTNVQRFDLVNWVKDAVREIGYTDEYADKWNGAGNNIRLDGDKINVIDPREIIVSSLISKQSADIKQGVDNNGWGDQGIFFGMYNPYFKGGFSRDYEYAREICRKLYESGIGGIDIKTQVSLYNKKPDVVVAIPFLDDYMHENDIYEIVKSVIGNDFFELSINGTGKYTKHSSVGDCGMTGRKLVCDLYGSGCRIGGGSPWTKDGTKADLSLNLLCRAVARAQSSRTKYCSKVACACKIGSDEILLEIDGKVQSLKVKPVDLIELFQLNKPIYRTLCRKGLFELVDSIDIEKIFALGVA